MYLWVIPDISKVLRERARLSVIRLPDMRLTQCTAFRAFRPGASKDTDRYFLYSSKECGATHPQVYDDILGGVFRKNLM